MHLTYEHRPLTDEFINHNFKVVFQSLHRGLVKKRLKIILHEESKKEIPLNWTSCYYRGEQISCIARIAIFETAKAQYYHCVHSFTLDLYTVYNSFSFQGTI